MERADRLRPPRQREEHMTEIYAADGTRMHEVTVTLKLLVREDETKQMARDVRRVLASRKALRRLLTSIVTIGVEGPEMITRPPNLPTREWHDTGPADEVASSCPERLRGVLWPMERAERSPDEAAIARAVLSIHGPPPEEYQCHVCCPPGEPCPCDSRPHGNDEFCDCDHTERGAPPCPGCEATLTPTTKHAEGCEWLRGVKAGVQAVRAGRTTPWSEVKRELGIEDAPQDDKPDEVLASRPGSYGDGLHHTHVCPACVTANNVFLCRAEHPARGLLLHDGEVVALCPRKHLHG